MKTPLASITVALLLIAGSSLAADSSRDGPGSARFLSHPRGRHLGTYQRRLLSRMVNGRLAPVDSLKLVVIRVSFSDLDFKVGAESPVQHDSLYYANELRHLNEYFLGASLNKFHVVWELVPSVVRLSRPEGYYGEDGFWGERVVEMLMETVQAVDTSVDFSMYDAFAVIHAGSGQETDFLGDSPWQLWSGFIDPGEMEEILSDTLGTPGVPTGDTQNGDTVYVDNLMVLPEESSQDDITFSSLGLYVYQVALRLGMLPLFDSTPSNFPDSQGIGSFGLMGYGLYNASGFIPAFPCAFHRYMLGWARPVIVDEDRKVNIKDINSASLGDTSLVKIPISSTEYFLVANRVHDTDFDGVFDFVDVNGNGIPENEDTLLGAEFDFFLTSTTNPSPKELMPGDMVDRGIVTGSGLMIWHVDETVILRAMESGRNPNDNPHLKGVDLEEADGIQDLDKPGGDYAFGSYLDSFREGNNTRFGPGTVPSSCTNSGIVTFIEVRDISEAGTVMSFEVRFSIPAVRDLVVFGGSVGDLSSIPVDIGYAEDTDLVIPVDRGLICVLPDAGSAEWSGQVDTLIEVTENDTVWSGSPVFADIDMDDTLEIFIASERGSIYAFKVSGSPYMIDVDTSPASLALNGSSTSSPMVVEVDGDGPDEIIFLSSRDDSVFAYIIGCSSLRASSDRDVVGYDVAELRLVKGKLISHPARGLVMDGSGGVLDGFFFLASDGPGDIDLHFVPLISGGQPQAVIEPVSRRISGVRAPGYLLTPSAGDIDLDGSDEMIVAVPGRGLIYCSPFAGMMIRTLKAERPSSAVLGDINGDGVLETVLRDENCLYILTGYGVPLGGWPVRFSDTAAGLEEAGLPPPPLVGDLDGDGEMEVLFRVGGDLYAYESSGVPVQGWPLPGDGYGSGSPAFVLGAAGELYIITVGAFDLVVGGDAYGPDYRSGLSSVLRYSTGCMASQEKGWPFYRRDAGGSSRQKVPEPEIEVEQFVKEESFVCYPNPASGNSITVRIDISVVAELVIRVLNLEGEKVMEFEETHGSKGNSLVPFEKEIPIGNLTSGIYICCLDVEGLDFGWKGCRKFAVAR